MAFSKTYHEDSDADDEFERSVTSPRLPPDSDASPIDSDPPSTQHTPTTYGYHGDDRMPRTLITEWTAGECADYVSGLGLPQYADAFLDNEIVGEALIALKHEELKEMGVASVGHRLTVLKSVYDVKIRQEVPVDSEHYVPLSAETDLQDSTATQADIARIIDSIKIRDERIIRAEAELSKLTEEYRTLRKELLPVFLMAKGPLPPHPSAYGLESHAPESLNVTSAPQPTQEKTPLSRKLSTKMMLGLGSTPKNSSPTHIPPAIQEGKGVGDGSKVDPSLAAAAASHHLTASITGGSQQLSPAHQQLPSPTSPPHHRNGPTLASQTYAYPNSSMSRSAYGAPDEISLPHASFIERDARSGTPAPARSRNDSVQQEPPRSDGSNAPAGGGPSVEIFKSFRVSMDDPCHRVLPAALKKYNINADWKQYALYIVYGDEERCLELDEKPLILFKQLDKEGRKPMFMLRKIAPAADGHPGSMSMSGFVGQPPSNGGGSGGSGGGGGGGRAQAYQSGIQLPGGVL
ncbi:MAG: Adaptor for signal transduction [Thelocarpon impressellum]|nr:MAG: Adaptor for signal transduction [Thelocarpon impressellum]